MKTDILSRNDIYFIIADFYKKLVKDRIMYPFFKDIVAQNDLVSQDSSDVIFYLFKKNNEILMRNNTIIDKSSF